MSTSELALKQTSPDVGTAPAGTERPSAVAAFVRLLRSELRLVMRRRRNLAMLAVLACGAPLIGIAVKTAGQAVALPGCSRMYS